MPMQSEFNQREVTLEIEDVTGVAQADSPTSVLSVYDFTNQPYVGDDKVLNFDSLSNLTTEEIKKLSPKSIFGFKAPLTKPDAGVIPSWANLFRACGMNVLDTALATPAQPQLIITQSLPTEMDTATIREYQAADASRNHHYVGVGGTGNISLDFVAGSIPEITVGNFTSSYVRPDYVAPFVADRAVLNAEECKAQQVDGHVLSQLDGIDICIQSISIKNMDSRDIGVDDYMCREYSGGKRKPLQIEVIYMNPIWATPTNVAGAAGSDAEFNPWELGESHDTTNRVPFIMNHELGTVWIGECQPINTEKLEFGKLGLKCIKQTLNVLSDFELRFNY